MRSLLFSTKKAVWKVHYHGSNFFYVEGYIRDRHRGSFSYLHLGANPNDRHRVKDSRY